MEAYVQNLHSLLEQTVAPDTQIIKNATATLNAQYYKSPECIPGLFEVVASSPMDPVRQLAAVELRKRVGNSNGNLWKNCPQDIRTSIKSRLLEVILVENRCVSSFFLQEYIFKHITVTSSVTPALVSFLRSLKSNFLSTPGQTSLVTSHKHQLLQTLLTVKLVSSFSTLSLKLSSKVSRAIYLHSSHFSLRALPTQKAWKLGSQLLKL